MTNTLLAVFTGILAIAVLTQSVLFLLTFLSLRKLTKDLFPQIQKLVEKTEATFTEIKDIAENIKPVAQKLAESAGVIHDRVVEVDGFVGEVVEKSRREIAGIEESLHSASQQIQYLIGALSGGILAPVNRINALTKAVRVAAGVFFRRNKKEKADEETSAADTGEDTIYF